MTTNEFIQQLKELDPNGQLTIAFNHTDEHLVDKCAHMEVMPKSQFTEDFGHFEDEDECPWPTWKDKRKILVIYPFENPYQ